MKETELFVASIIREDRSLLDLLTADHTFVNERLAEHYGIPRVYGSQFRRVTLTDPNRRGLLGKGSILTVTSYPNRTSVVLRGKWILENLLGTPPPPPPADVPELVAKKDGKALSLRAQMEQHRRTRSARRATRAWTRSGSRSKITTASGSGATKTPASASMRAAGSRTAPSSPGPRG